MRFIVYLIAILMVGTATAQNPTILQGNYITNVFGQSNFVLNPNAQTSIANVTVSSATVTRSTTTPLVATSEFNITTSTSTGYADWATRTFDAGMKNQNCEARFTYRGFSVGSTTVQIRQGSNTVAQLTLTASTDPRIASINFPCGDLLSATTLRVQQATASLTGTNEIGGIYVGLATNQANVAQAELVGTWKMTGAANCLFSLTTTSYDQFTADSDCNSPVVTGSVVATQGKRPWIDINNPKPGNYYVVAKASFFNTASNVSQYVRLTAAKSAGNDNSSQSRIYGGSSNLIIPVTLAMNTAFTSGTLGFVIEALTDNAGNAIQLVNDNTKSEIGFEVYRFPTSSELVVTPERQNTWGGVVYTSSNQSLFGSSAENNTYTTYNNATWNQPTLLKGKAAVTVSGSGNDLGFSIPNMPVGNYKLEISGLINATNGDSTTANDLVRCNFRIVETDSSGTVRTEIARQSHQDYSVTTSAAEQTRDFINSFSGTYNNTSVTTRNFVLQANKFEDSTTGNTGGCQAYSNTGSTQPNTNITFLLTPLDQPSNSALYVQGPVLGAQTGAAIPSGYVGEEIKNSSAITQTGTTTADTEINVTNGSITLGVGVWELEYSADVGVIRSPASTANAWGRVRILEGSNNISGMESFFGASNNASSTFEHYSTASKRKRIEITSGTKTYQMKLTCSASNTVATCYVINGALTGTITGDDAASYIRAVRVN